MVIDSSALIAILLGEPGADGLIQAISTDGRRFMSALNLLETAIVIHGRKGDPGHRELDQLLAITGMTVVDLTLEQVTLAREAYRRFGKGYHPARLNLGDCCAYALARHMGEPLLFKGDDFSRTDIEIAPHS